MSYVRSFDGVGRLVVQDADAGVPLQVTSDPMAQAAGSYGGGYSDWSPDGSQIVYRADDGKLWLISASGGIGRRLARGDGDQRGPAWSPDGERVAFIDETDESATIVVADVPAGATPSWPRPISRDADFVQDATWSPDSQALAWHQWNVPNMAWDRSAIVRADVATGARRVVAGSADVATAQPRFSPDGRFLAFLSDETGFLTLWLANADGSDPRPLLKEPFEVGPPAWSPGARTFAWSPDSAQIAYLMNDNGNWRLYAFSLESRASRPIDRSDGQRGGLAWSARNEILFSFSSPTQPVQVRAVSVETGETRVLADGGVGGVVEAGLASPEPLSWTARDGARLRGHLYRPSRPTDQRAPLLVLLHGGPTGQFGAGWSSNAQYFVQRGWTVFAPEYRGSTGYGRAYTQALRHNWGVHDVHDTLDGIAAVLARGGVDPDRVAVMGGSAGGYTVLMLLALAGDRIRVGVDLYGVTDLWELENGTHRLEAHYNHTLVGPLPDAAREYDERSPLQLADRIKSPLLVLQGDLDPAVPKWESDLLVERVKAAGGKVTYHVYLGEGHGWSRSETVRDALERIDRFLVNNVVLK